MAKKTPAKSAAKKKTAKKRTTAPKKTAGASTKKTATTRKKTPKAAAKKKTTSAQKPAPKKPDKVSVKKDVTVPELLKQKFETWQPKTLYTADVDEGYLKGFSAPPLVDESKKEAAERIKALVLKKIDLTSPAPKEAPAPEKPEARAETEVPEGKKQAKKEAAEEAPKLPEEPRKEELIEESPPTLHEPPHEKVVEMPAMPAPGGMVDAPEPPNTALKMLIGCIASVFAVLLIASGINMNRYYLKTEDNALEIFKGVFSPTGMRKVLTLPGAAFPGKIKKAYSKKEVTAIAFAYYLNKADALLSAKGKPDFKAIKSYLDQAAALGVDATQKKQIAERISRIKALKAAPAGPAKPPQKGKGTKGQVT